MDCLHIHQQNCRHSAAAQSHFLTLNAKTAADVFLIQEPYFYRGNLTAVPNGFLAFHAVQQSDARVAIVAHRRLNPIARADHVHNRWLQVDLQEVQGTVAAGYCPPKDDIMQQLSQFTRTAITPFSPTRRWKLLGADINAYHEVWGSQPNKNSEQRNSLQWKRGLVAQQWIVQHGGKLLNDSSAITFCSDKLSTSAIDVTLWWTNASHLLPSWTIQTRKHLSDHYPITTTLQITEPVQVAPRCDGGATPSFPYPTRQQCRTPKDEDQ